MRSVTKSLVKVGVALAAVEVTSLCGIWKDSASTIAGYENAKHSALAVIVPQIRTYLDKVNVPKLVVPDFHLVDKWNYGVSKSLSAIAAAPNKIVDLLTFPGAKATTPHSKASSGSVASHDSHGNSSLRADVKNMAESVKDSTKSLVDHKPPLHSHLVPVNPHLPKAASSSTEPVGTTAKANVTPPATAQAKTAKDEGKDLKAGSTAKPDDKKSH
ncbi:hypothetical protein RvY_15258-2 [Ramazzottius varieornatus]|uniref:MICOS complex subunit MIC13 n=1 Tax=Ramazzottius varieornatus TaxID=947166 RepID=A0A1D1VXP9_RAMVA|nr:hypothetical protein RvY_15258-2 [Ramazzottius varieornatus]